MSVDLGDAILRIVGVSVAIVAVAFLFVPLVQMLRSSAQAASAPRGLVGIVSALVLLGVAMSQAPRLQKVFGAEFRERAQVDADAVKEIRDRAEAQETEINRIAEEVTKAYQLGEQTRRDQADQLEVGDIAFLDQSGERDLGGMKTSTGYTWGRDVDGRNIVGWLFIPETKQHRLIMKCDDKAKDAFRAQIAKRPNLPFPYVLLGNCMKLVRSPESKSLIDAAIAILSKTVKVPGHHVDHDVHLALAQRLKDDSKPAIPAQE
jgi:hypothetical protein